MKTPKQTQPDTTQETPVQPVEKGQMTVTELAHKIAELAEDKQASNITLIDLRDVTVLADYFIICTVDSGRQAVAVLDSVAIELKKLGFLPLHPAEGEPSAGWTLLDYGSIVVHVFNNETRDFYKLEQLWKDAPVVLKIQ